MCANQSQTHYLTMDFSVPDLLNRTDDAIVYSTRTGYRSWLNPVVSRDGTSTKHVVFDDELDDAGASVPPEGKDEGNGENDLPETHAVADEANKSVDRPGQEDDLEEVQILQLHSSNPIISYRGQIFSGTWSDIIGTELIFAKRDPEDPLPAIRHLSDHVDLVGASSARIACTQAELQSRLQVEQADRLKKARKKNGFVIAVPDDANNVRRPQALFLENLMAIKRMKGEGDAVTVKTVDRAKMDRKRLAGGDNMEPLRRRRRSRGKRARAIGQGRRARGSRAGRALVRGLRPQEEGNDKADSLPTPARWDDLLQPHQENAQDGNQTELQSCE